MYEAQVKITKFIANALEIWELEQGLVARRSKIVRDGGTFMMGCARLRGTVSCSWIM